MRRFRRPDTRSMARPNAGDRRVELSPRARLIGGWLVVIVLILVIAAAVRLFGGNADGSAVLPSQAPSASPDLLPISFGTELGADRLVVAATRTNRFTSADSFAYSVDDADAASVIYVSVRRIAGGPLELVQAATEGQPIPGAPGNIGFRVATSALLSDFGPGTYEMLIHLTADGPPVARGTFQLVDAPAAGDEPSSPQP